ncbi:hypothetical protein BDN67DRAFT_1001066 [Paxillus ammoniavirescens]|nr:hypothetical protein BDN67DRAFT_1001066 [Paxillus ammoniavirescens]
MALTATAQSALPTWDETIVPALRKRLESESRILSKRMSVASISSFDDSPRSNAPSNSGHSARDYPASPYHAVEPRKSSAIPRPSLQYPRTTQELRSDASANYTRVNGASSSFALPFKRARTYSQPYTHDTPPPNGYPNGNLPTPDSSRPTSPRMSDVKPTRIPIAARGRTTSTSSHAQSIAPRAESRNGILPQPNQAPTPEASPDLWVVKEVEVPQPTTPPMVSIRHQASSIMNEPAPFATSSITSSTRYRGQEPAYQGPRPSHDSEERPFEHWYRGDVHRNGGVGELRVARHVEMLQIANYGHSLRNSVRAQTRDVSGPIDHSRRRKRADSVGTGTRDSLYLDDDRTKGVDMVLDEGPLTDIEADPDTDPETFYDAYAGTDADNTMNSSFTTTMSGLPLTVAADTRSKTPTNAYPAPRNDTTPKRLPATRTASEPLPSNTPSGPPRTSGESMMPTPPSSGSRPRSLSRTTSPTSQLSDHSLTKRRAKSPGASLVSTPKKAKTKNPPSASQREDVRASVATYPTPEGNVVDAIPTWTQPVQKSSNWDEACGLYLGNSSTLTITHLKVVLPVVARKKGLDGQYEQADGSPRPKPPGSTPIKPVREAFSFFRSRSIVWHTDIDALSTIAKAPGTFGYDYTKYRAPRGNEEIPMNEFGQFPNPPLENGQAERSEDDMPPEPIPLPTTPEVPIWPNSQQVGLQPSKSPAPFSQYRSDQVPTINVTRPSSELDRRPEADDEDVSAGCCKCIIM